MLCVVASQTKVVRIVQIKMCYQLEAFMKKIFLLTFLIYSQVTLASALVFDCKSTKDLFSNAYKIDGVTLAFNLDKDMATLSRSNKNGEHEMQNYYQDSTEDSGLKTKFTYTTLGDSNKKLDVVIKSETFANDLTLKAVLFVYDELGIENANELICKKRL
jgi:hypothetical protein